MVNLEKPPWVPSLKVSSATLAQPGTAAQSPRCGLVRSTPPPRRRPPESLLLVAAALQESRPCGSAGPDPTDPSARTPLSHPGRRLHRHPELWHSHASSHPLHIMPGGTALCHAVQP